VGARRFFVADTHAVGDRVLIEGSDAHKIVNVLRLSAGDVIEVADSGARVFDAILEFDAARVYARLTLERATPVPSGVTIDVAQGIPKGQKMDYVVEKLTELGVRGIIPLQSERVVARDPGDAKLERWRRLARAAAAQSGAATIPEIEPVTTLDALTRRFETYDAVIVPWELAEPARLRDVLPGLGHGRILVVIGPEGGFSHEEAEAVRTAGAALVSLGQRILRTETAGLVLAGILRYQWD